MTEPYGVYLILFLSVVGFCLACWVGAVAWSAVPQRRLRDGTLAALAAFAWVGLTSVPVGLKWVTLDNPLPGMPLQVALLFVVAFGVGLSSLGRRLALGVPLWALVGFQGMRFPLELVLHGWGEQGIAPPQMTFMGSNLDIVAGVTSLVLAPFVVRSRAAAWVSQLVGIGLLVNVLRVVALSMPTPLRTFDDVLLLPFSLPTLWIATVCVLSAILVHILTVRRLLLDR